MLPLEYPKWQVVYYYFNSWKHSGVIERIQRSLTKQVRKKKGKKPHPTVGIIDAQSVKSTLVSSKAHTGFDGGKKIKGIKRHISVDTLGLLLIVVVHPASKGDRKGAELVLNKLSKSWPKVEKIFVDGGYALPGRAGQGIDRIGGYDVEIVKRPEIDKFTVMPKRWIVERTFAWIETNRRNAKSYERLPDTAEAVTQLSIIRNMLKSF
jgi:putative transposase